MLSSIFGGGPQQFADGQRRKLVIVGGGYGGVIGGQKLAAALKNYPVDVVVLDKRDQFHHAVGSLRAVVEPGFEKQVFIPYTNANEGLPNLSFKTGVDVKSVEADKLVLSSGETIPYDYAVVATGGRNREPGKFGTRASAAAAQEVFRQAQQAVKGAKSFVIVGGGAVGCELAGELLTDFPHASVTVVHDHEKLLNRFNCTDKLRDAIKMKLTEQGCKFVLGERANIDAEEFKNPELVLKGRRTITTNKGTALESDVQFILVGNTHFNGSVLSSSFPAAVDAGTGEVRTKDTFQVDVPSLPHVFAIGDVASATKYKTVINVIFGVGTLSDNIVSLVKAEVAAKATLADPAGRVKALSAASGSLKAYGGGMSGGGISLGRNGGRAELPVVGVIGDWAAKAMKSKDMMVPMYWKTLHAGEPPKA